MEARESSAYFDEFPDLLAEILSRIQVKTLCKLRCVCKQWRDLISNPDFQSLHHHKSRKNPTILYLEHSFQIKGDKWTSSIDIYSMNRDGDETCSMSIPSLGRDDDTFFSFAEVASSSLCRDLICMVRNKKFYVCNPSTQDLIQLGEKIPKNSIVVAKGFGYDGTRDEYICIRLVRVKSDEADTFETFNFSRKDGDLGICNNEWRKFDKFSSVKVLPSAIGCAWGIMVEGIFYWIAGYGENNIGIFSLDLHEENYEIIPPPPSTSLKTYHSKYSAILVELERHICMVDSTLLLNPVDVWMLKRKESKNDNASWAKVYSIYVPPIFKELDSRHSPPLAPPLAFALKYVLESIHLADLDNLDPHELVSNAINAWRLMTKDLKLKCSPFSSVGYASLFCLHTDNFFKFRKK